MKNIHRLRARGYLTEMQVLTAARFYRAPNTFNLSPTIFRILREIIIDEVPLETMEEKRGWSARSAKTILSVLLYAIEEAEGMFWSDESESENRELLAYLEDTDGEEIRELCARHKISRQQGILLAELTRNFGKTVSHDQLIRRLYAGRDEPNRTDKILSQLIHKLRKVISRDNMTIRNISRIGYLIEHRSPEKSRDLVDDWQRLRNEGKSYAEIGDQYGRNASTVMRALEMNDIGKNETPMRT